MGIFDKLFKPNVEKLEEKRDVEGLIKALVHEDSNVRRGVAYALGEIKDPRAVEPLIQALEDEDWGVRCEAAYALGKMKDERAVEALIQALNDKNSNVRERATWALGEIGDERAVEPLIQALKDKAAGISQSVQETAAEALGKFKTNKAKKAIEAYKPRKSLAEMVKMSDVKGISEVFQKAGDWDTREWAVVALGNISSYDKSEMIGALKDIIQVCKAERTGGTYRTACLENAEMLLKGLGKIRSVSENQRKKIYADFVKLVKQQTPSWFKQMIEIDEYIGERGGTLKTHSSSNLKQIAKIDKLRCAVEIGEKYGITREQLMAIEKEGKEKKWPPYSPLDELDDILGRR